MPIDPAKSFPKYILRKKILNKKLLHKIGRFRCIYIFENINKGTEETNT